MLAGCGGGSPAMVQSVSVTVATTASTVDATDSVTLTASVDNDKNSAGVTWSVSGGGALSNQTTSSAVYTAPAASSSALTVTVTATSVADTTKLASETLTVPAAPSITTTATQLASSVGSAYSVTLAGSGGIAPYTWKATGLPACLTLSTSGVLSGSIQASCAGTTTPTFTLTDSGSATALTASQQLSVVIAAAPAISFTGSMPATATYNTAYSGSAAATGGVGALTYTESGTWPTWLSSPNSSTGAVTGTPTGVGPFSFSVQAADAYGDSAIKTYTVTVAQATPTISISNIPSSAAYGGSFTATISYSGDSTTKSVVSNSTSICTVSGTTVSYVGVGTCSLTASATVGTDYAAVTGSAQTFSVTAVTPTISINNLPSSAVYGGSFTPTFANSGNGVASVASNTTSICTVTSGVVNYVSAGSCSLTASTAATTDYAAATGTAQSFSIAQATPTISINDLPSSGIYGGSFTPTFANSGNGTASVASNSTSVCTVTSGAVNYVGVGSCSLTASTAATTDYAAATGTAQSFSIAQATPTISISNLPSSGVYGGSFTPTYANSGNGVASVASNSPSVCTVISGVVSYVGLGSCSLTASAAATADYVAVAGSAQMFSVSQATPTISINNLPSSGVYGGSFTPTFANSGNGAASVASNSASVCTVISGVVNYVGVGNCSLTASTAPTTDYAAATGTAQIVAIAQATPTVSINNLPSSGIYGGSFTPTFTNSGNGTASAASSSPSVCTVTSGVVNYVGAGSCYLTANTTATTDYAAATGATQSITIAQATPTISINDLPSSGVYGGSFTPTFANSGNGAASVASTSPSICTVTSGTVNYVGVGSCALTASTAATTDYVAATGATQSFAISQATPTISINNLPSSGVYGGSFTATFANSGNGTASIVSNTPAVCTVSGSVVSYIGAGSCSLTASTAPTTDYVASTGTAQSFAVAQVALTITASSASVSYSAAVPTITPSYMGFVNGDSFSSLGTQPACTTTYSVTSDPGSYPTSCSGAVDGNYAINYVAGSVTVSKATPTVTTPPTASGITYGSALSASNLTGAASVAGSFTWTAPTTIPGAGTPTEGYIFTPTITKDYATVTGTVSISVAQATSVVSVWPSASGLVLGQTLASSTFSGGSTTPAGSFAWTTPSTVPGAGTTSYSVLFTPADKVDYTTVTGTVSVTVAQAATTISSWPTATGLTYGQTLQSSTLTGGTASVGGHFTWTTPSTVPGAGTAAYGVTFTPNDTTDYTIVTGTVSVTVAQATPSVSVWPTAGGITYGQTLQASSFTGGTYTPGGQFTWTTPSTVPGAGTAAYSVTFTPSDTTDYTTVTGMVSVAVAKATLTVTASSSTLAVGTAVPTITPSYSGFVNGDTAAVVTTAPTCSTTYTTSSVVGSYPTSCSGGAVSSNYAFSFVPGTVTVVAFSITTSPTLANGYVGSVYSPVTLAVAGGTSPFTWGVVSGALPTGLNLSSACTGSSCVISGTPTGPTGTATFKVQVQDSASNSAELQFTITIGAGITISTASPLTPGVQGTAYAGETMAATGGTGSYSWTWAAASGSLPAGLALNSSTGAISGTPTASGTYSIVVKATDTASNTASTTFSLTVYAPLSITTTTLPGGTANTAYTSTTLAATGGTGTYTWSWAAAGSSTLPSNMTFSTAGVLAGTPAAEGNYSVVITVKDTTLNVTSSATLTIAIAYAPLSITTTTLPVGSVGTAYTSTQFAATGGSNSYTWSWAAASGSLLPANIGLSTSGVLSGTPSAVGSYLVQVTATDATASLSKTVTFTINIDSAGFSITTANPLPIDYVNSSYVKGLAATGGSGTRTWKVSSGALPTGMSLSSGGSITGTPTAVGTYSFTVMVNDTGGNQASATFSLTVVPVLAITTTTLPSGTVGVAYSQTLTASGGSGNYSWSAVTSSLPAGLTLSSSGVLSGSPTTAGSNSVSVTVTDTDGTVIKTASASLTLKIVNPPVSISGQISLVNNCAGATIVPPIAVTLSSNTSGSGFIPVTANTDSAGNYSFSNVPVDSYTITPVVTTPSSGTTPSSVFYPAATKIVTVSTSNLTAENFTVALGYSVSGTVAYGGAQTSGQIYLRLNNSSCGSNGALGTSIAYPFTSGSTYTINGVPPGSYTLQAWMDNSANVIPDGLTSGTPSGVSNGVPNVVNPTGSTSGVSLTEDLISNAAVTLTDPTVTAVSNTTPGPSLNLVSPTDQGVVINFSPVTNTSSVEAVTAYQVQWSSSASFPSGSSTSSYYYEANGNRGIWILNNSLNGMTGTLTNGNAYYFRARGLLAGNKTAWTYYGGLSNPTSVTIGAAGYTGTTSNAYGRVYLPSSITGAGQLYVGLYDQSTGTVYANRFTSLSSPASYSLYLPNGENYVFFTILDQNNNGLIDIGDITNLNSAYSSPVTISQDTDLGDYTLAASNSTAAATTQMTQSTDISGTTTTSYGVILQLQAGVKLPVAAELSAPAVGVSYAYLLAPVDFSACTSCGSPQFDYLPSISSAVPTSKDDFQLQVTYSDGSTDSNVYASVSGVGASNYSSSTPTTVAATGLQRSGTSTTPNFGWTDPGSSSTPSTASNYRYSFSLSDSNGNVVWQIPSSSAQVSTFDSTITDITWGSDPTGNTGNTPSPSSLTSGAVYTWSIKVVDSNGNSSTTQASFKP